MRAVAFAFRHARRSFRHDRAYTLTIIGTLALTIGATAAVFSVVNGVCLRLSPSTCVPAIRSS
jgi:hypothetical protein